MDAVTSRDGTRIAYWHSGTGPPLLLVHGMVADHSTTWQFVLSDLARHFTVYAMDRRGRGDSADALAYDLQREAEDIVAVVKAIAEPVNLLGHSYGGLCSLEAALLTPHLRKLILYESVPVYGVGVLTLEQIERLDDLLQAKDLEGTLVTMLRYEGMSVGEIEMLRSQPEAWARRVRNARTVPREERALTGYTFVPERYASMRTPTLLLVGAHSPPHEKESAEGLARALPDARIVVLSGQGHLAMYTAPQLFVQEVVRFLES
jgi:pimeloyl-ACP methyl ester carboxylesterase